MKTGKLLLIIVCVFFCSACNFLNVDIEDTIRAEEYYATETELNIALNGVYATLAESHLYGNSMLGRLGLDADEGFNTYSADNNTVSQYSASPSDMRIMNYWRRLYEGINRANLLIDNIDNAKVDSLVQVRILGEAMFLRAYYYSMLVTRFSDVPLVLHVAKSGNAADVVVPQTKAEDIYEFIFSQMESAADMVGDIDQVESPGRVSRSTVWGILARLSLYAAGNPLNKEERYEDAAYWAKKVIDTGKHKLNPSYEQVFINYAQDLYDKKESIWEVEFWGNNSGDYTTTAGMVGRNNGILNRDDYELGYTVALLNATAVLYDSYAANGSDLRRDWAIGPYYYTGNPAEKIMFTSTVNLFRRNCGKFRREYETLIPRNNAATPQNFPLLRYSDVLLMYAEAVNQKNNRTSEEVLLAYESINQVRRRGYGLDVNTPNATVDISPATMQLGENLLRFIQDERSRELCFECLRKDDLIRWGIFYPKMRTVYINIPTGTASYLTYARSTYGQVSERDVIWPIPSYELGVNNLLKQNKGW